ncbi:PAS domain S-box-containing protein [bacterium JGI 053]|nr:PAS domain S-box-containing protein [bacterium JGI 053]
MTGTQRARILMVDDRPENLMALEAILEPLGHELVRALSGEEALREVLRQDFACILLDVQMPGMNGFETAELIKGRERSRFTPIVFLTAISKEDEFVFQGYSVGAVDYMFKPFNPDILRSKVSVFIDLYLKTEQLRQQELRLRESERVQLELEHRSRLLESEARMAEIVESAQEAIITFGDDGVITLFNEAAEGMFGLEAGNAIDTSIRGLFDDFDRVDLDRVCAETRSTPERRAGGRLPQRSLSLTGRREGAAFPVEASMSCLELEAERVFTMIARDVSERKAAEEALRQQAVSLARTSEELQRVNHQLQARQQELEAAMSARSRFYASMSHELRTPINAIMGYSALLLDDIYGPLNPEQTRGIERANKAAKHLLELVNDILDLSKIEAGKLELEIQPATFPNVVQDLFVTVRPLADQHGSELALEHAGEPVTVITDARRVRQILLNLLSNAIKFGEGKPITVHSRARDDGGVEIDVTDLGIGIPGEDLEKIFDEFVQLSQPNQHQGTGLGLPISRRLAVLLDGSLTVRSAPGEGSTFRLTLPAKVSDVGGVPLIESGFPSPNSAPSIDVADLPTIPDLPVATPIAPIPPPADAPAGEPAPEASSPDAVPGDVSAKASAGDAAPSADAGETAATSGDEARSAGAGETAATSGDEARSSTEGRRRKRDGRARSETPSGPAGTSAAEEPVDSADPAAHVAN